MTIECQVGVDRANSGRAFADRGRDSFGRSGADVADGEEPGWLVSNGSRGSSRRKYPPITARRFQDATCLRIASL